MSEGAPGEKHGYRGRIAPSPTGYLHLGHARTFWIAQQRALAQNGTLVLRNEDLDPQRCRLPFALAMIEDLNWFGIHWHECPDRGGPYGPYAQSQRFPLYRAALDRLRQTACVYPCKCSRRDVLRSAQAPHATDQEPIYPGTCRPSLIPRPPLTTASLVDRDPINWRFRVPDGLAIVFDDALCGPQSFVAGREFGDFVVWRHDDVPSYQLAVVVDDAAMRMTEVVRGADLLLSTARQILLYRALGMAAPQFCHCPLLRDAAGVRLAKRSDAASLRALRAQGADPVELRAAFGL